MKKAKVPIFLPQMRRERIINWCRDRMINFLLDCLCWVLPADQRFELIIEPWREDGEAIAAIYERDK